MQIIVKIQHVQLYVPGKSGNHIIYKTLQIETLYIMLYM